MRELGEYLNRRRLEIAKAENRTFAPPTWRELAYRAGVPENTLLRLEKGLSKPDYNNAVKLAAVFGDKVMELCKYPEPAPNDWRIRLINKLYERGLLTEADIEKLADTAKRLAESNKSTGANLDELELGPA